MEGVEGRVKIRRQKTEGYTRKDEKEWRGKEGDED